MGLKVIPNFGLPETCWKHPNSQILKGKAKNIEEARESLLLQSGIAFQYNNSPFWIPREIFKIQVLQNTTLENLIKVI